MPSPTVLYFLSMVLAALAGAGIVTTIQLFRRPPAGVHTPHVVELVERAVAAAVKRHAVSDKTMDNITGAYDLGKANERATAAAVAAVPAPAPPAPVAAPAAPPTVAGAYARPYPVSEPAPAARRAHHGGRMGGYVMTTEITDNLMYGFKSGHYATKGDNGWQVSWLPGRILDRNQVTTAMVLAEHTADGIGDHTDRRWVFIDGWAAELGLSGAEAVAMIAASAEELGLIGGERPRWFETTGGFMTEDTAKAPSSPGCSCPSVNGTIRHLRNTCHDAVVHRLGWFADTEPADDDARPRVELVNHLVDQPATSPALAPAPRTIAERGRYEWERALMGSALPPIARLVALVVSLWTGPDGCQGVWLSMSDIGRYTGLTPYMTKRWLDVAEREGWIRAEPGAHPKATPLRFLAFPS